jgi:hypothetical protein
LAEICKFLYDFFYKSFIKIFFRIQKKIHKQAAVDYIMFKIGIFLSISYFVCRAFIKKGAIYIVKKTGLESQKEINILVNYLNKSV